MTIPIIVLFWTGSICFPPLLKYIVRNIDNHMAHWKVIALINGNIEAISGPGCPRPAGSPRNGLSGKGKPLTKLKPCKVQRKLIPGST